ncbi:hypothetical protein D3C71_1366120 [compost metagenome]
MANIANAAESTPARNGALRKMATSSMGYGRRRWRRRNSTKPTTKISAAPPASGPFGGACATSLIATTSPDKATRLSNEEIRSHGLPAPGVSCGANSTAPTMASSTIGTLIRNTAPHQKCASSTPPTIGPRAAPTMEMQPHTAMARLRSRSSSKVRLISASVAGIIAAAPTANSARAAISRLASGANAASSEAMPKIARPIRNMRRCPRRSPSVPAPNSRPAITKG